MCLYISVNLTIMTLTAYIFGSKNYKYYPLQAYLSWSLWWYILDLFFSVLMIILSFGFLGFFFFLFYIYQKFIFLSKVPVKKILLYNKKVFYITLAKIQIAYSNYKYMQSIKSASALLHAEAVFSNIWSTVLQSLNCQQIILQHKYLSPYYPSFMEIWRSIFIERYYTFQNSKKILQLPLPVEKRKRGRKPPIKIYSNHTYCMCKEKGDYIYTNFKNYVRRVALAKVFQCSDFPLIV